ncbi:MAG: glycosyltransferase [Myxococcota bacterium]
MLGAIAEAAFVLYSAILVVLAALAAHRAWLAFRVLRAGPSAFVPAPTPDRGWPRVLVQLPVYNERFAVEGLLEAVAAFDYPRSRLCIQILDDSTDETVTVVARAALSLRDRGHEVQHLRRPTRDGFKAGALAYGLSAAPGAELIAIFDADFRPGPRFLAEAVGALERDPQVGMVQARWGHQNRAHSALTEAQALLLDAHFRLEHRGRDLAGHAFNFNGTAGVWRRRAIEEAGGWSARTLTEDLDLSYRAQLAGWRFLYRDDLEVPSELPERIEAFRAQQGRWARGGVETARALVPTILGARHWSIGKRLEALAHLLGNAAPLGLALLGLLLPLAVYARILTPSTLAAALDLGSLGLGSLAILWFYSVAAALSDRERSPKLILSALVLGAGVSVSAGLEALLALLGHRVDFARTPKRAQAEPGLAAQTYPIDRTWFPLLLELAAGLYHLSALGLALWSGAYGAAPFFSMYAGGALWMGVGALLEKRRAPRRYPLPGPLLTSGRRGG